MESAPIKTNKELMAKAMAAVINQDFHKKARTRNSDWSPSVAHGTVLAFYDSQAENRKKSGSTDSALPYALFMELCGIPDANPNTNSGRASVQREFDSLANKMEPTDRVVFLSLAGAVPNDGQGHHYAITEKVRIFFRTVPASERQSRKPIPGGVAAEIAAGKTPTVREKARA